MRVNVVSHIGRHRLISLQPDHLRGLYAQLLEAGLSATTVHHVHTFLHKALKQAALDGLAPRNVVDLVTPPRPHKTELQVLTPQQVKLLLAEAHNTRHYALIATAVYTGLRQGELLGLRWQDVDLEAGKLTVARQLGLGKRFSEPKSAAGRRTLDISAPLIAILREHRAQQNELRLMLGGEYVYQDLMFATSVPVGGRPAGGPQNARNVYRDFKAILRRAGLPEIRFHDLRHTAATLMLLGGVNAKTAQVMLGHSQIQLTLGTYSHVLPSMTRDAADRVAMLLA